MEKSTQEPAAPHTVERGVCMKQISRSEAKSGEGDQYTPYFCGLDCYQKWKSDTVGRPERNDDRSAP